MKKKLTKITYRPLGTEETLSIFLEKSSTDHKKLRRIMIIAKTGILIHYYILMSLQNNTIIYLSLQDTGSPYSHEKHTAVIVTIRYTYTNLRSSIVNSNSRTNARPNKMHGRIGCSNKPPSYHLSIFYTLI